MSLSQPTGHPRERQRGEVRVLLLEQRPDELRRDVDLGGGRMGHGRVDRQLRCGQEKRRMWTLRTRPMAMKAVSVLEPP